MSILCCIEEFSVDLIERFPDAAFLTCVILFLPPIIRAVSYNLCLQNSGTSFIINSILSLIMYLCSSFLKAFIIIYCLFIHRSCKVMYHTERFCLLYKACMYFTYVSNKITENKILLRVITLWTTYKDTQTRICNSVQQRWSPKMFWVHFGLFSTLDTSNPSVTLSERVIK